MVKQSISILETSMQQTVKSMTMWMMTLVRPFKGLKLIKFVHFRPTLSIGGTEKLATMLSCTALVLNSFISFMLKLRSKVEYLRRILIENQTQLAYREGFKKGCKILAILNELVLII